jgi:hypothetical protein
VSKLKIKQITSGGQPKGSFLVSGESSGLTFSNRVNNGITFPSSSVDGDLYYRTDLDLLFIYDGTRSKWLTVERTAYSCGRSSLNNNTTGYFGLADMFFTSTEGFNMPRNGTIVSVSFKNSRTVTRDIFVSVNNSSSIRTLLSLSSATSAIDNTVNVNFNAGDIIQAGALVAASGNRIKSSVLIFEVAWRA